MLDAYDRVVLSESDKQEIKRNTQGKIILGVSAVLILFACAGAIALGVIGLIGLFVGFIMVCANKSEYTIRQEKALSKTAADLMIAQARAGQKINLDTPTAQKARQKEETKDFVMLLFQMKLMKETLIYILMILKLKTVGNFL